MDLSSLRSVKDALAKDFKHDRLDILLNNAGIIAKPPSLSVDGYEIQFATNHLGHAMVTKQLLPYLLKAANEPDSDVRIVNNTSDGYEFHHAIKGGIAFADLDRGSTMSKWVLGPWIRYAQSKLANILFATEFARRYPQITSVSIHPGVVETTMITDMATGPRYFNATACWLAGVKFMEPHQGAWSQLWCSAGAKKEELRNGGFYRPVGRDCWVEKEKPMTKLSKDEDLAKRLWNWTEEVLERFS
jgi:NAD(P)-dependent dehydrogenase (short-subunit alcohol dehydrogenase family)